MPELEDPHRCRERCHRWRRSRGGCEDEQRERPPFKGHILTATRAREARPIRTDPLHVASGYGVAVTASPPARLHRIPHRARPPADAATSRSSRRDGCHPSCEDAGARRSAQMPGKVSPLAAKPRWMLDEARERLPFTGHILTATRAREARSSGDPTKKPPGGGDVGLVGTRRFELRTP